MLLLTAGLVDMQASIQLEKPRGQSGVDRAGGLLLVSGMAFCLGAAGTVYFCRSMSGGMAMPGGWTMSMIWMRMPGQTWAESVVMFLLMWLAMMVAMMLPSALPLWLAGRRSLVSCGINRPGLPVMLMAGGYFFVWLAVGAVVYAAGMTFALGVMHSDELSRAVPWLSGAVLALAGGLQFTSWKLAGLRQCRCPEPGGVAHETGRAAWRLGCGQGVACTICCAPAMLALVVLGTMNLGVMVMVAAVIALEKLAPKPEAIVRISGAVAVVIGLDLVVRALSGH